MPIDFNFATSTDLISDLLVVDISIAEELLGEYGKITRLELTAPAPGDRAILKELDLRLIASRSTGELEQLTESFHLNLTAFGFLGFAVGLFIVYSTLGLAFEQRRGTYMSLRSLGVPIRTVYAFTLTEIIVLALIGGIIGIANSKRNGNVSSSFPVFEGDQILISTNKGRVIRISVKEIRVAGRNTQGVRIIKLSGDEKVVSAIKLDDNFQ